MFLGIEIGGTKLQLGVGRGDGRLVALERFDVEPGRGAQGILEQIERAGRALVARHQVRGAGIGFGGPVDPGSGRVVKSHHVAGWDDFPIVEWSRRTLLVPAVVENDCDAAGLAEARLGAGRKANVVLYVTVGTGIGGGLVVDGHIYRGGGYGAAEIGHLRPGLEADRPEATVESIASGWGIAAAAQARLAAPQTPADAEYAADLHERCGGQTERLTAYLVAQAAGEGNQLARDVLSRSVEALGWAVAQAITLTSPNAVVVGGGVSLAGERLFLEPLRRQIDRYVFGPALGKCRILPAELGEEVVVHGAIAAAADASPGASG